VATPTGKSPTGPDVHPPAAKSAAGANLPAPAKEVKNKPAQPSEPTAPSSPGAKDKAKDQTEPAQKPGVRRGSPEPAVSPPDVARSGGLATTRAPALSPVSPPSPPAGTAPAAAPTLSGGVGLAVGAGLGAAFNALTKRNAEKQATDPAKVATKPEPANPQAVKPEPPKTQPTKPEPANPQPPKQEPPKTRAITPGPANPQLPPLAPAPAPAVAKPAPPPVKPVEPRLKDPAPAPHEPPKVKPAPAPREPPPASNERSALPVPAPSSSEFGMRNAELNSAIPIPRSAVKVIQIPHSKDELPPLHPATDPPPAPGEDHGLAAPSPASAPPASAPRIQEQPRDAGTLPRDAASGKVEQLANEGWVPLKHSTGAAVRDVERDVAGLDDGPAGKGAITSSIDPRTPADNQQSFDLETPRGASTNPAGNPPRKTSPREGKLETVLYKVEGKENFWDISRMHYYSGRYYKALWKANIDKVPQIDKLYRGTVLRIPPLEDLDPAYIDPPGTRARQPVESAAGSGDPRRTAASPRNLEHTANSQEGRGDGIPIRRSSRADAELNLPVSDVASDEPESGGRSSRGVRRAIIDDQGSEFRPRDAVARPIYKVRQYDTLRTIARDTLGDSHRASEILELNRDIIDDPRHLPVGQILELPEDARPARARSRR
ncbi:MAG: LysM peptidoglycan-binding domain-containing protein, partial [Isosphaeraceae bacterium]